ncbi:hypothetical protein GY45DRAFT_1324729 [Cubamyces sp. BRFM 1775]|nr:hypothetical protein GY45DRAFT_1324729 [Cubamyces sp. BRFM 1775]
MRPNAITSAQCNGSRRLQLEYQVVPLDHLPNVTAVAMQSRRVIVRTALKTVLSAAGITGAALGTACAIGVVVGGIVAYKMYQAHKASLIAPPTLVPIPLMPVTTEADETNDDQNEGDEAQSDHALDGTGEGGMVGGQPHGERDSDQEPQAEGSTGNEGLGGSNSLLEDDEPATRPSYDSNDGDEMGRMAENQLDTVTAAVSRLDQEPRTGPEVSTRSLSEEPEFQLDQLELSTSPLFDLPHEPDTGDEAQAQESSESDSDDGRSSSTSTVDDPWSPVSAPSTVLSLSDFGDASSTVGSDEDYDVLSPSSEVFLSPLSPSSDFF